MQRFADILKTWPFRLIVRPTFACKSLKSVKYSFFSSNSTLTMYYADHSLTVFSGVHVNHNREHLIKDQDLRFITNKRLGRSQKLSTVNRMKKLHVPREFSCRSY